MKKKWVWIVILLLTAVGIWFFREYQIPERITLVGHLRSLLNQDSLCLAVDGKWDGFPFGAEVFRQRLSGEDYYGLQSDGVKLYFHDEGVYFDNGRGYDLSDFIPEEAEDWNDWLYVLLLSDFEQLMVGESTVSRFVLTDQLLDTAQRAEPELASYRAYLSGLSLTLTENGGLIQSMEISTSSGGVRFVPKDARAAAIPTEVLMVMKAEETRDLEEVMPLIRGCLRLAQQETVGASVDLNLECGPLPISDQAELYFSSGQLWFLRGGKAFQLRIGLPDRLSALFPGLAYLLCRDAVIEQQEHGTAYTLTIPPEQVKALFDQLLPEAAGLKLQFEKAVCRIQAEQERILSIAVSCTGDMPFLITRIPIAFSMDMTLMEGSPALPAEISE